MMQAGLRQERNPFRCRARSLAVAVAFGLATAGCGGQPAAQAAESQGGALAADQSPPTAARTSDEFRVADYCTIVLAPKLAAELGLNVVQRVQVAMLEDRLLPGLKGCLRMGATGGPLVSPEVTMAEKTMLGHLDRDGEKALAAIALDNLNTALRVAALAALQNWGTAESIPTLQKAAQDSNRTIQIKAQQAIEAI